MQSLILVKQSSFIFVTCVEKFIEALTNTTQTMQKKKRNHCIKSEFKYNSAVAGTRCEIRYNIFTAPCKKLIDIPMFCGLF